MRLSQVLLPAALLASLFSASPSIACSIASPGVEVIEPPDVVPFDGVWSAVVACHSCETLPPSLVGAVTDEAGNPVPGRFELQWVTEPDPSERRVFGSGFVVWRPDSALVEGGDYSVTFEDLSLGVRGEYSFSAGASLETAPELEPTVRLRETYEFVGPEVCCAGIDDCSGTSCGIVPESATRHIAVEWDWRHSAKPGQGQYQYQVTVFDEDHEEQSVWNLDPWLPMEFPDGKSEVCIEIGYRSLVTSEEGIAYEGCTDLSAVENIGEQAAIASELRWGLGRCLDPGEFTEEWCSFYEEPLNSGDCTGFYQDACEEALERCPGVSIGSVGAGGAESDGGELSESSTEPSDASGCSFGTSRSGGGLAYWLLLGFGLLHRRRRRS